MRCKELITFLLASTGILQAQQIESQIERARNYEVSPGGLESQLREQNMALGTTGEVRGSDVGEQWLLKVRPERYLYGLSASVAGYYTNNVALTRQGEIPERFLIADAGGAAQVPLAPWLQADFGLRFSIFRYEEFRQLDFNSVDATVGLSAQIWNVSPFLRYSYTGLFSNETGDSFFKNHVISVGVQKVFPLAPAHYLWVGSAAAFGFSDPAESQRNEYSIFTGYHLDVSRAFGVDVSYRLAWLQYIEGGRDDLNQSVSLALQYRVADWLNASGSVSYIHNVSDSTTFDYQAVNAGVGLSLGIRF